MNKILSLALMACVACPAAFGQKIPSSAFLEIVENQMVKQCEDSRAQAPTAATAHDRGAARAGVLMQCECMPGELKELRHRKDLPVEITQSEAMALLKPHIERCTGRALRQILAEDCALPENIEDGIKDQKAYCACLSAGVEKLSDAEIGDDALAASEEYQKNFEAQRDGEAKPEKRGGVMDAINNQCRAEQGLPPKP